LPQYIAESLWLSGKCQVSSIRLRLRFDAEA
jgi:hypothetical protein